MLMTSEQRGNARLGCAAFLFLTLALVMNHDSLDSRPVALHSELAYED